MKIEVRCPHCNDGYLLDEEALETGMPCLGCGRPLAGPAHPQPVASDRRDAQAPAAQPREGAGEVVCPRCNLHFKPRPGVRSQAPRSDDRPTVLIVEDMAYFREVATEALGEEFEVLAVATRAEAGRVLARGGIDLMILDLTLDGGDGGIDLLRELDSKPCPVLIYTAQDESEMYGDSWDRLRRLGADDIVFKGINVGDQLVRKVSSLLGREVDDTRPGN